MCMSLKTRLILSFVLIALVPAGLVGWIAIQASLRALEDSIGANFQGIAHAKADAIDQVLTAHVEETRVVATHPMVIAALATANLRYAEGDPALHRQEIQRLDQEWLASGKQSPTADAVYADPLSAYLRDYKARDTARYGEIFVTDRLGAAVAMTKRLSDYDQSDEAWWREPVTQGTDGLFIDDRGLDASVGALILGVVVPVVDQGEVIGVVKINYEVQAILEIVEPFEHDMSDRVLLARSNAELVADSLGAEQSATATIPVELFAQLDAHGWGPAQRDGVATLAAHAHVDTPINTRIPTEGAIKGVSGERWSPLGWQIIVEAERTALLEPVQRLRRVALVLGAIAMLVVTLIALWTAASLSRPIGRLRLGAEAVGSGDLDHRVGLERKDELGMLSQAFDAMAARLKTTTASRDELDREVQERKRTEQTLQHTLLELARSNEELEQFAYVASHDLQEPLRKVRTFGDRLASRAAEGLDERSLDYLARMQNAAERMQKLIDALLSYSRVSSKGRPFAPVKLDDVMAGVLSDLETRIERCGARVTAGSLPEVQADAMQMQQLLQNLVGNALKFTHPDRPAVVEITAEPAGEGGADGWCIQVRDNGIGFDADAAARIFEPFHRLHARSRYEGTGMGLAICAKIVQRHGGTLTASGTPDQGACFEIHLPHAPTAGAQA
jgi:signal transduction histidine kinase